MSALLYGSGFRGSAVPPARNTAGQIEKETNERRTSNIEYCNLFIYSLDRINWIYRIVTY